MNVVPVKDAVHPSQYIYPPLTPAFYLKVEDVSVSEIPPAGI